MAAGEKQEQRELRADKVESRMLGEQRARDRKEQSMVL